MLGLDLLQREIVDYMEREQIPGLSVAVLQNDEVVYAKGFGYANLEGKEVATPETIYGVASVTKSFTALVITKLVERGVLGFEDSVTKYLPSFSLPNVAHIDDIQIHHLLSHTSGIATVKRDESITNFSEHLAYLKTYPVDVLGEPGAYFCYNNDLFLLLGAIIEKVTGKTFEEVVTDEILIPNGMKRSTVYLDALQQFDDVSEPYEVQNGKLVAVDWPTLGNYKVGGGVRSTVLDLLKYGQIYLRENLKMTQAIHPVHGKTSYAYGLQTTPYEGGRTLIEHGGSQPGVSSNFGFIPEENLVVAVLTNVSGASAGDIWLHIVNAFCDLPLDTKRMVFPENALDEGVFEKYIGNYRTGEGSKLEIFEEDGKLWASVDGEKYALIRSEDDRYLIEKTKRPLKFFVKNDKAWALLFGVRMFIREEDEHETIDWH